MCRHFLVWGGNAALVLSFTTASVLLPYYCIWDSILYMGTANSYFHMVRQKTYPEKGHIAMARVNVEGYAIKAKQSSIWGFTSS